MEKQEQNSKVVATLTINGKVIGSNPIRLVNIALMHYIFGKQNQAKGHMALITIDYSAKLMKNTCVLQTEFSS